MLITGLQTSFQTISLNTRSSSQDAPVVVDNVVMILAIQSSGAMVGAK